MPLWREAWEEWGWTGAERKSVQRCWNGKEPRRVCSRAEQGDARDEAGKCGRRGRWETWEKEAASWFGDGGLRKRILAA